jgi:hypothetical protein
MRKEVQIEEIFIRQQEKSTSTQTHSCNCNLILCDDTAYAMSYVKDSGCENVCHIIRYATIAIGKGRDVVDNPLVGPVLQLVQEVLIFRQQ